MTGAASSAPTDSGRHPVRPRRNVQRDRMPRIEGRRRLRSQGDRRSSGRSGVHGGHHAELYLDHQIVRGNLALESGQRPVDVLNSVKGGVIQLSDAWSVSLHADTAGPHGHRARAQERHSGGDLEKPGAAAAAAASGPGSSRKRPMRVEIGLGPFAVTGTFYVASHEQDSLVSLEHDPGGRFRAVHTGATEIAVQPPLEGRCRPDAHQPGSDLLQLLAAGLVVEMLCHSQSGYLVARSRHSAGCRCVTCCNENVVGGRVPARMDSRGSLQPTCASSDWTRGRADHCKPSEPSTAADERVLGRVKSG